MKVLKLTKKNYQKVLSSAIQLIKKDKVIVCPTDTVYGLLAAAISEKALKRVFEIKKRSRRKPIPVFVKDLKMAGKFVHINKDQEKFLKNSKITSVLKIKAKKNFPNAVIKNKKVGIRIPNYKILNDILQKLNFPLTGTSANISGEPASTKIKEVIEQFKPKKYQPDLIINAGNLRKAKPSTVIDLTGEKLKILRK